MGLQVLFFYLFAFIAVASAFMVIAARNPVYSVLFLILTFFNSAGLFLPANPSGYQIGTVTWTLNGPVGNGSSGIIVGFLNPGVDGLGGAGFANIADTAAFNGATVNVIPEPGTAGLLGLGIVGLVLAGRRSRRA